MSLQTKIMDALRGVIKARDTTALESLRAIKSAILLAKTGAGAAAELAEEEELELLQKLVKQRKDSTALYARQGRNDLAELELAQVAVIEELLPKQLSEAEVIEAMKAIIAGVGGTSAKDMDKVVRVATKQLTGKTDGKVVSAIVKSLLA